MFMTKSNKRAIKKIVQEVVLEELRAIGESYKREESFVSECLTREFIKRYMDENLVIDLGNLVCRESFLDDIITRIKSKQI